jgi:hypothetical protein
MFNVPSPTLNLEPGTLNRAEGATLNIEPPHRGDLETLNIEP